MNLARFVTMLLTMFATCAIAADDAQTAADPSPQEQVIALDDAWIDAEVSGDREALERILHEEFLATYASGQTIDRTMFIQKVVGSELAPFRVIHDAIRLHGDTALVIDLSESGRTKYTWIAVKRNGQWRVISETFSRVEPP